MDNNTKQCLERVGGIVTTFDSKAKIIRHQNSIIVRRNLFNKVEYKFFDNILHAITIKRYYFIFGLLTSFFENEYWEGVMTNDVIEAYSSDDTFETEIANFRSKYDSYYQLGSSSRYFFKFLFFLSAFLLIWGICGMIFGKHVTPLQQNVTIISGIISIASLIFINLKKKV